jgi:hypothetical protein
MTDQTHFAEEPTPATSSIQMTLAAWKASQERAEKLDNRFYRLIGRALYRLKRERLGFTVRTYHHHNHAPQAPSETAEDYARRKHRDATRTRRGVTAETVRPRIDLSEMTPDELADHKRSQANERKRKQRRRPKADTNGAKSGACGAAQNSQE